MQPERQARLLSVNGAPVRSDASTLGALLAEQGMDAAHASFACAVNGLFVPRSRWSTQTLDAGDNIDIVAPVVGG